ncbi:OsmC family protein [Tenacibaculum agarivorans]|uniref:OsmC family protein n=1 Tax=Tenacibaculum agarivorans TaxID=1908389 RepID=UPI00094B8164|nr:OsmC family protein [Tenacibaculum agarivorans]
MKKEHKYAATVTWRGNKGKGTIDYKNYERSYEISIANKPQILGSSDVAFRGDGGKYNPEELLITSIASCHMLWYLHLCAEKGIVVTAYEDQVYGVMNINADGSGYFSKVILNPTVTISEISMKEKAIELHQKANEFCFIANSINFPIEHIVKIELEEKN